MPVEEERSGASPMLDRDLIVERLAVYRWANYVHSRAMLEECFSADAVWEGKVRDEHRVGPMRGRGRIVDWLAGFWPHQRDQRRHLVTDFAIEELDSGRALLLSCILLTSAYERRAERAAHCFYQSYGRLAQVREWVPARPGPAPRRDSEEK